MAYAKLSTLKEAELGENETKWLRQGVKGKIIEVKDHKETANSTVQNIKIADSETSITVVIWAHRDLKHCKGSMITIDLDDDGKGLALKPGYKSKYPAVHAFKNATIKIEENEAGEEEEEEPPFAESQKRIPLRGAASRVGNSLSELKKANAQTANALILAMATVQTRLVPTWKSLRGVEMPPDEFYKLVFTVFARNDSGDIAGLPTAIVELPDELVSHEPKAKKPERKAEPRALEEVQPEEVEDDDDVPF